MGAGLVAYSFAPLSAAQSTYDANPTQSTSEALTQAHSQANLVMTTGVVGVALGAGLWIWAP